MDELANVIASQAEEAARHDLVSLRNIIDVALSEPEAWRFSSFVSDISPLAARVERNMRELRVVADLRREVERRNNNSLTKEGR